MFLAQRRFEEYISVATHFISLLNLSALLPWHFVNKTRTATTEPEAWYCYKLLRSHGTDLTSANAIKSCLSPLVQVVKIGEVGGVGGVGGVGVGHWTLDMIHWRSMRKVEGTRIRTGLVHLLRAAPCYFDAWG